MPKIRSLLVSFSVNSRRGLPSQCRRQACRARRCDASIVDESFCPGICRKEGFGWSGHHVQVLRNHRVGSTCSAAASGPRLHRLIWIRMSVGTGLRVLDEHVEISVVVEYAGIEQLVFQVVAAAPPVRLDQIAVRICVLRVFIEILHVRVGRRAVEVKVVFLDVLAVIALALVRPNSRSLRIGSLPFHRASGKAQPLVVVAEPGEAVLAPVIGARARLIVREIVPGIAVLAVVLADRAPLALAEIRSPQSPGNSRLSRLLETSCLRCRALGKPKIVRHGEVLTDNRQPISQ